MQILSQSWAAGIAYGFSTVANCSSCEVSWQTYAEDVASVCRYLGGYIAAAFFAVGAPAALCIGYLCDKMNRRNLLFYVVILGERLSRSF